MIRLLRLILLCLLASLALAVAACGGGDSGGGDEASEDTDVDTLLADTFNGKDKKITSGNLDFSLRIDAKNTEGLSGPVTLEVSGPFQTQGEQELPKFKIDFAFEGAGQNINAGLTSTGDKGFVAFQDSEYAVTDQVFQQFKTGYEQAQKQGNTENQSLASLGLDPRQWLTSPKNEGEKKVGDDDTIKITGGVNVDKLLDDVNQALKKTRELGVQGTQGLPSQLTAEQKKQVVDAVKDPKVEIYTGKEDKILRRMVVALGMVAPKNSSSPNGSADFKLDFSLTELNKAQEVEAPSGAKPFDQLLSQLGGLGLGGLGGAGAGGSGSGSGSGSSGASGANNANLEKYSQCVSEAGGDTAKARKCADLLTP